MRDRPQSPKPQPTPNEEQTATKRPRFSRILSETLDQLKGRFSKMGNVAKLFSVSDEQLAEILARVREELPTTEALLLGKPQAGKSSIVRGITGVSPEIIGQGFRPHTQNTQRYAYPSEDLPLLVFTDTVGLGDTRRDTQELVAELLEDLNVETRRARILILTVKITDFATDTLQEIARQLRQQHPEIPCLLAITSLHDLYSSQVDNHPEYPPEFQEVQRVAQALEASFASCYDAVVWLDFTLEEDGFTPVFYGLEALRDAIADLLPEAEARAIHELLDDGTTQQLGDLYRDVARRYIIAFSVMAATVAAVPLPFATMPVLTTLQVSLVGMIGRLYGQTLSPSQAGGVVSAIAGGFLAQMVGRELIKFIPGLGSALAASWAAAYTWALGEGACVYFGDLMGGKTPDPEKIQAAMNEAFETAKRRFRDHSTDDHDP
ncbi:YcjF family protein [Sodalinema gerasimenkoae]|uniref:YcjF family protein n=1 Tax=Sodalinema gerasimenkoae TaxID=2862348 RepID=UPI0013587884|nr:GTPase [Sodalinema gerasimenkoae]